MPLFKVAEYECHTPSEPWRQVNYISDPSGSPANVGKFGYSLAVDGYYLLAGAPNDLRCVLGFGRCCLLLFVHPAPLPQGKQPRMGKYVLVVSPLSVFFPTFFAFR